MSSSTHTSEARCTTKGGSGPSLSAGRRRRRCGKAGKVSSLTGRRLDPGGRLEYQVQLVTAAIEGGVGSEATNGSSETRWIVPIELQKLSAVEDSELTVDKMIRMYDENVAKATKRTPRPVTPLLYPFHLG